MNDRDTFAAAALTGLLSNIPRYQLGVIAVQAYDIADEMIAERSRTGQTAEGTPPQSRSGQSTAEAVPEVAKCTERENDHDAVPDARARDADRGRTDKAVTRPGDGTGNTPSKAEIDALEFVVEEGRIGNYGILRSWLIRLRPEWESQSHEESDDKRVNTNTNRDTTRGEGSVHGEGTVGERLVGRLSITQAMLDDNEKLRAEIERLRNGAADGRETVCPHVRGTVTQHCSLNFTLSDEEWRAIEECIKYAFPVTHPTAATLRKLLERLK